MQQSQDGFTNTQAGHDPWNPPLAAADQACKECRRRKAKCNKGLPTCGHCLKYRRHCLYEKHSRTPLTRKHLTEVEERLERAETILKRAGLLPSGKSTQPPLRISGPSGVDAQGLGYAFDFSNIDNPIPTLEPANFLQGNSFVSQNDHLEPLASVVEGVREHDIPSGRIIEPAPFIKSGELIDMGWPNLDEPSRTLEVPPMDDFEWDEQDIYVIEAPDGETLSKPSDKDDQDIIDGMASLTVDGNDGGYLGIASGAALLRIIDPVLKFTKKGIKPHSKKVASNVPQLYEQLDPHRNIVDSMIDSYFGLFHLNYPVVHEPTFRAQYTGVIPRPSGNCWHVLAYVVAAIGVFTTSTSLENIDLVLFSKAKSLLSIHFLESGNLTLVQALLLISNYVQKRNKPNSGYNYLGLAVRMGMGLGLHKEFQGWNISPLKMEIRRRVWWSLCIFDAGSTITFSRPMTWPGEGIEVALPMNIYDRDLTAASTEYPNPADSITPYTAVRAQASFHVATNSIYRRVISKPFPTAATLLELDSSIIAEWLSSLPSYFSDHASVPPEYCLAHAVMNWRYRNFRIIMYRPFVISRALNSKTGHENVSFEDEQAYSRCLDEVKATIFAIAGFWDKHEHTRQAAWYALYFLFQAALIPCICLRNFPTSPLSTSWREQPISTLATIDSLTIVNSSASRCHQVITGLCGPYLQNENGALIIPEGFEKLSGTEQDMTPVLLPIDENLQVQMNSMYNVMWPNGSALQADVFVQDDAWMDLLRFDAEAPDLGDFLNSS